MSETGKRKGSAMNIEIAQQLYELRRKHGFSQESLAAELGLSRQAISKWERSESAPDMGNLIALADLYGITLDELIRPTKCNKADSIEDDTSHENTVLAEATENQENIEESERIEDNNDEVSKHDNYDNSNEESTQSGQPTNLNYPPPTTDPVTQSVTDSDIKQVMAHGHIYTKPASANRPKCKLRKFPYPLLVTVLFLIMALVFSLWEYVWLFLTIPFYYWIARIIERDPNFLKAHGYQNTASANPNLSIETSANVSTNQNNAKEA